jgi:4,5-dihydroxyphthalate decarboxylase
MFTERRLGYDYWPVGVAKNCDMLKVIVGYMMDDGLISTAFSPEQMFPDPDILST